MVCTTVEPSTTNEEKVYSDLCGHLPTTSIRGDKYSYVIYVYGFTTIIMKATKNRSDKEMIEAFK